MKRLLSFALAFCLCGVLALLAACDKDETGAVFTGKIAIVTNTVSQNEEAFRSAEQLKQKYGSQIVHYTWPEQFMQEQAQMIRAVERIAADPNIKAVIFNQAVQGAVSAIDKLLEMRGDMLIICCDPHETAPEISLRANLILDAGNYVVGPEMIAQAAEMGAKAFVYYSFPRHMSIAYRSAQRDMIRQECQELGIQFIEIAAPDPNNPVGNIGTEQFMLENVPGLIAEYGPDTAFFATDCAMQESLINAVLDSGAIYVQGCCSSPYHVLPGALGLAADYNKGAGYMLSEAKRVIEEKGMSGRVSAWPVSAAMLATGAAAEYAVKWINGDVPKEGIDLEVLALCMSEYILDNAGINVEVGLQEYSDGGSAFNNYQRFFLNEYCVY